MTLETVLPIVFGPLLAFGGVVWGMRRADKKDIDRKITALGIEIAAFKLEVAQRHPTHAELARIEGQIVEAINNLTLRIDRLLEREK